MNRTLEVYLGVYYFINMVLAFWALGMKDTQGTLSIMFIIVGFWVFAALVLLGLYLTGLTKFKKPINKVGLVLALPVLPWLIMKIAGCF